MLNEEVFESVEEENNPFEITDMNSLNWVFRQMSTIKSKEKEIKALAESERQRINDWEASELSPLANKLAFWESKILQYHVKQLAEDPKAKTISTPYGSTKARANKAAPDKVDEAKILTHVIESGMEEFIKPTLKWGDFKKQLKIVEISGEKIVVDESGQKVPGVIIKPDSLTHTVEVK